MSNENDTNAMATVVLVTATVFTLIAIVLTYLEISEITKA